MIFNLKMQAALAAVFAFAGCCSENVSEKLMAIDKFAMEDEAMVSNFKELCTRFPARLSGSESNKGAQGFVYGVMEQIAGVDVSRMQVQVPHWIPGESRVEIVLKGERKGKHGKLSDNRDKISGEQGMMAVKDGIGMDGNILEERLKSVLSSVNLGLSVGTGGKDLQGPVIEIKRRSQFDSIGDFTGKIVFFNEAMASRSDYGKRGWQRRDGAALAGVKGAVAVVVRSLTNSIDDFPHTGVVRYADAAHEIPAIAISTMAANRLSAELERDKKVELRVNSTAEKMEDSVGDNIIGEIKGSKYPNQVILLTAHLDSWMNSQGAQDDGGNVAIIINVLRTLKAAGIQPYHTIRVMPYQDEETGLSGMHTYAAKVDTVAQTHIFHIEMDGGIGIPREVILFGDQQVIKEMDYYVSGYLGNSSEDALPLHCIGAERDNSWPTSGKLHAISGFFYPDNPNYFTYHHAANDNLDAVDITQLRACSAALTKLIYLIDRYNKNEHTNHNN